MVSDDRPSKTQQKKHMLALQALGAELAALNDAQLDSIALPEALRDAVIAARRISSFEARRRQLQYIGKLMRSVDPEPIRARLDAWKASSNGQAAQLHRAERWREEMLEGDEALDRFIAAHPHADAEQLRVLVRNTRRERAQAKPPRSYRALFRLVRDALEDKEDAGLHEQR